jgi:hypothetical protein
LIYPPLLSVSALDDELVGASLLVSRLITQSGLTPRGNRCGMTDGRTTLTTTVGVIAGVHDGTADSGTEALMAGLTGLTDLDGVVLEVADLTDGGLAVQTDDADLTGGQTDLSDAAVLGDELSHHTGSADELSALTGVKLDVVNEGTNGDVGQGQGVTDLDVSLSGGGDDVANLQALGSDDVALNAGLVPAVR